MACRQTEDLKRILRIIYTWACQGILEPESVLELIEDIGGLEAIRTEPPG